MAADAQDLKSSRPDEPSLADMLVVFRRGSALVDAALATLAAIAPRIDAIKMLIGGRGANAVLASQVGRLVLSLGQMLDAADVEGDNLLLAPEGRAMTQTLVVFALARQASGTLSVQSIEIDRAAVALSDGDRHDSSLTFDRLFRAGLDMADPQIEGCVLGFRAALDAFLSHTTFAASRLSIAKAQFDLQSSVLRASTQADPGSLRLEDHLDATGTRDMAVETRRLLSRQSLNIANGNLETLPDLLHSHATKLKPDRSGDPPIA